MPDDTLATAEAPAANAAGAEMTLTGVSAPTLHAGAIFDSLDDFKQAVRQDQKRGCYVVHKKQFSPTNRAYICQSTNWAIQDDGVVSARGDLGARDRQWWRHGCGGACGFVAEARRAHVAMLPPTDLGKVMQAHAQHHPHVAAPSVVGMNGVREGQWVVTLYRPHTCAAVAVPVTPAVPTSLAAIASAVAAAAPAAIPSAAAPFAAIAAAVPATPAVPLAAALVAPYACLGGIGVAAAWDSAPATPAAHVAAAAPAPTSAPSSPSAAPSSAPFQRPCRCRS
jgi:hypothetical protein